MLVLPDGGAQVRLVMVATPGIGAEGDVTVGEFGDVEHGGVVRLLEHDAELDGAFCSGVSKDDRVKRRACDAVAVIGHVQNGDLHKWNPFLWAGPRPARLMIASYSFFSEATRSVTRPSSGTDSIWMLKPLPSLWG